VESKQKIYWLIDLIWTKSLLNLKSEASRNILSYIWWILEPFLYMLVFYIVFEMLLNRGGENYTTFLIIGLIPWMWLMKSVSGSSSSIINSQALITQIKIHPVIFPLTIVVQTLIKQIPVFILLIGFVWLQGFEPTTSWFWLIPITILELIIIVIFSLVIAALIPFVRDFNYLVPTGLTFLMFMSGIFYDYKNIGEQWQDVFLMNPMAYLIKCYRDIFFNTEAINTYNLFVWFLISITLLIMTLHLYRKLGNIFPKLTIQ